MICRPDLYSASARRLGLSLIAVHLRGKKVCDSLLLHATMTAALATRLLLQYTSSSLTLGDYSQPPQQHNQPDWRQDQSQTDDDDRVVDRAAAMTRGGKVEGGMKPDMMRDSHPSSSIDPLYLSLWWGGYKRTTALISLTIQRSLMTHGCWPP